MQLVFIESMSGISKKERPYNLIKLADPNTFENHIVSYDPNYIGKPEFQRGTLVELSGELRTPFDNTQFICTGINAV